MALKLGTCCATVTRHAPIVWSRPACALQFLQRARIIPIVCNPGPRMTMAQSRAHSIPLYAPLPVPQLQYHLSGEPAPDRGRALNWPHPGEGV